MRSFTVLWSCDSIGRTGGLGDNDLWSTWVDGGGLIVLGSVADAYVQYCPSLSQREQTGLSAGHLDFLRLARFVSKAAV